METTPNSQNFPQFMQAETVTKTKAVSKTEIADFRFNPAIQNRPAQILNLEKEENGIVLTLGEKGSCRRRKQPYLRAL